MRFFSLYGTKNRDEGRRERAIKRRDGEDPSCFTEEEKEFPAIIDYAIKNGKAERYPDVSIKALRGRLRRVLKREGFRGVSWNDQYPGVLINTDLKRFGMIHRSCKFGCVGDRNNTCEEFLEEVLWKKPTKKRRARLARERQAAKELRVCSKVAGQINDFRNR